MNTYTWAGPAGALLAVIAGALICFWGYRILKLSLAIIGLVAGAGIGWEVASSVAHASEGVALVCALAGGLIGMVLVLWLYYLGIFLLGAAAGTVLAGAVFNGTAHQVQPIILLAIPVLFGVIALLAQKFMIALSTAFSGSYLVVAGIWPFVAGSQRAPQIWLHPAQGGSSGTLGYAALVLWIVLALAGAGSQLRARHRKIEPPAQKT